jgi:hypothetical protein
VDHRQMLIRSRRFVGPAVRSGLAATAGLRHPQP